MPDTPETIYLIPGEDLDGVPCMVWCDDPAPSYACDPAEAVEYVRKDKHDEALAALANSVLAWWKEHECDTHYAGWDEFNVYDETPGFVLMAQRTKAEAARIRGEDSQ